MEGRVFMGARDWLKRQWAEAEQTARARHDDQQRRTAVLAGPPRFLNLDRDPAALITQRRWSDPPQTAVSVMWRPATRGGDDGIPTWFGETVDPATFDRVDVFHDPEEAERRRTVLFPVAGTRYRRGILNRAEFGAGHPVALVPNPRNKYDRNAIEVRDAAGQHLVGFVPQDRDESFAQGLLHTWLAQGPVAGLILSERAWIDDDDELTLNRGGITVLASPRIECVDVPAADDDEYREFRAARLRARGDAWPQRRTELRREIDAADDIEDRHFSIQVLIQEAYRLRDAHREALDDAVAACREQIDLAPRVASMMRQRYDGPLPSHVGFEQLAIILEKQRAYAEAADLVQQAREQGWAGDWDKRLERLHRRMS